MAITASSDAGEYVVFAQLLAELYHSANQVSPTLLIVPPRLCVSSPLRTIEIAAGMHRQEGLPYPWWGSRHLYASECGRSRTCLRNRLETGSSVYRCSAQRLVRRQGYLHRRDIRNGLRLRGEKVRNLVTFGRILWKDLGH